MSFYALRVLLAMEAGFEIVDHQRIDGVEARSRCSACS